MKESNSEGIAIIGMTGRFPGAANVDEFWRNIAAGVESISTFSNEELVASGLDAAGLRKDPSYVPARGILRNAEWFDAAFFGMNAREAEVTDPQQRLFLEASWEVLEGAGYGSGRSQDTIGVYAGMAGDTYYLNNLHSRRDLVDLVGARVINLGNERDYLAARVAYKLNLRGPALSISTACSTGLVVVCQACQGLLNYQCDLALAGGVSVTFPQRSGVYYQEGGIFSPDGHCRPFDARAQGTVSSDGLGVVLLKRLAEALNDGDQIFAVIKGFGLNNDGSDKVGFTAPGVDGQAEAIATAQAQAGFDPATISYVEAHGTATPIGDPIEIAALTHAFRMRAIGKHFCAIGSVKSNIGHLGAAAGVASLIKTVLALRHKMLPPSLHFTEPNPKIDFTGSPFFVNSELTEWKSGPSPRRAGVSSFGLGGTNAHVVLEEAPLPRPSSSSREWQLLLLSAKTDSALEAATVNLYGHFKENPGLNLADAAFTLQVGRRAFNRRRMLVCRNIGDAIQALETRDLHRVITCHGDADLPSVVFMFPGQGAQYVHMGADLYRTEPVFKEEIDRCSAILLPLLGMDLRQVLYPEVEKTKAAEEFLTQTRITQPALFTIEFALATLWMSWGIKPAALIGHSIGEYVAASLSGVFTLEDALALVVQRGQLIQSMPPGTMLAVPMPEDELQKILPSALSLATVNGPSQCVVSGPSHAVDAFLAALAASGKIGTVLHTSHAFHSTMMDPVLQSFSECVSRVTRGRPRIPFLSNLTGTWISAADAADPQYWAKHLRHTARFGDGIKELLKNRASILLEVGPGTTLSSLAKLQLEQPTSRSIISSMRHAREQRPDVSCLLTALGQLWLGGVSVDWSAFYAPEQRRRIPLPTYPFQREQFWIEAKPPESTKPSPHLLSRKNPDVADWFYIPSWKRSTPPQPIQTPAQQQNWLVFLDECGLGSSVARKLEQHSYGVIKVRAGSHFNLAPDGSFTVNPSRPDDYERLLKDLQQQSKLPQRVAHFWSVTRDLSQTQPELESFQQYRSTGFDSLLFLAQAIYKQGISDTVQINLVSNNIQEVIGEELIYPGKATLLGPCKVIPQEHPNLICKSIDVVPGESCTAGHGSLVDQVAAELLSNNLEPVVAYRGPHRWVQGFEHIRLEESIGTNARLRDRGVYLITGGFGKIGFLLAAFLSKNYHARLILMGRSALPQKQDWPGWLTTHGPNDDISRRIQMAQRLEEMGGRVMAVAANVADKEQVASAISAACETFGEINGVFHAAGAVGGNNFSFISNTDHTKCELQFQSKVCGMLVLEDVLKARTPDFVVLLSSLSTVLGGAGKVAYSAANHFMDAFALSRNRLGRFPWICVDWDGWGDDTLLEPSTATAAISEFNLTPAEGIEAFRRILGKTELSQIIVSTGDLNSRLNTWVGRRPLEEAAPSRVENKWQSHPRCNSQTAYVPVQNETEKVLANIWEDLLGIDKVGIQDNFFDLGGDSLLLLRLQVKISQALGVHLSPAEMFEYPTINTLARRLSQPAEQSVALDASERAQLQRAASVRRRDLTKQS